MVPLPKSVTPEAMTIRLLTWALEVIVLTPVPRAGSMVSLLLMTRLLAVTLPNTVVSLPVKVTTELPAPGMGRKETGRGPGLPGLLMGGLPAALVWGEVGCWVLGGPGVGGGPAAGI